MARAVQCEFLLFFSSATSALNMAVFLRRFSARILTVGPRACRPRSSASSLYRATAREACTARFPTRSVMQYKARVLHVVWLHMPPRTNSLRFLPLTQPLTMLLLLVPDQSRLQKPRQTTARGSQLPQLCRSSLAQTTSVQRLRSIQKDLQMRARRMHRCR